MPESPSSPSPASQTQPAGADPDAYIRLHITPFDADLLKVVVPASALPKARGISYHTLQTFPEKRYGFVELPTMDAEKIKKKLNGAVLKGSKMRVEKARPEPATEPTQEEGTSKKRKKKSKDDPEGTKKRKRDYNVLPGVELEDRKVKRGWTVTDEDKIKEKRIKKDRKDKEKSKDKKDKKKREERSKYTDKEECLLKTKLPANAPIEKRKKGKSRETVIHEFANTTKYPSFLKASKPSDATPSSAEYVEGKGWVDEEGNVVEPVKVRKAPTPKSESRKKKAAAPPIVEDDTTSSSGSSSEDEDEDDSDAEAPVGTPQKTTTSVTAKAPTPVDDDATSSSGSSSDGETDSEAVTDVKAKEVVTPIKSKTTPAVADDDDTSSSGSSSDEEIPDADEAAVKAVEEAVNSPLSALKGDASRPKSSSSNVSLTIKIPPATPAKVHPLEALYKRARSGEATTAAPADEAQPFSFFGGGGDDDIEEDEAGPSLQIPMTPYTQEDFEWRNLRSAAPTPDTAHPSKMKNFWAGEEDDEVDVNDVTMTNGDDEEEEAAAGPAGDFQKWFWENRRDLNKSWMKRKKTAAKEKRHRENKSRANKTV
ncbi:hypothetical protein ACHAQA_005800 [Verticillium albo-atrum]